MSDCTMKLTLNEIPLNIEYILKMIHKELNNL